jgi:hypothetical protein
MIVRVAVLICWATLGRFLIAGRFGVTRARGLALEAVFFVVAADVVLFPRTGVAFALAVVFLSDAPDLLVVPDDFLRVVDAGVVVVERCFALSLFLAEARFDVEEDVERPPLAVCFFAINT